MKIIKCGHVILSVQDWFDYAPPKKKESQWKDGRSAKELAKAWFLKDGIPAVPCELMSLLNSSGDLEGVKLIEGYPEHVTRLGDGFPGGTRNADLVLIGEREADRILISIEAKADEPFGATIERKCSQASDRSNVPERIRRLCCAIFGRTVDEKILKLRYQLLHGVAATLIEAKKHNANIAVFVVHEFVSYETGKIKMAHNHEAFANFIKALGKDIPEVKAGILRGQFWVPGNAAIPNDIPLYLGKVTHNIP